jgi:hypothetical protein
MARDRRLREINYQLRDYDAEINRYQQELEAELGALERKKLYAKNNLAGATWEQSISTQMQAVNEKYRTKIQVVNDRATSLRREAEQLKQVPPK